MGFLSESERVTLAALCETLVPAVPDADQTALLTYAPVTADYMATLEETLENISGEDDIRDLKLLLRGLDNRLFNGMTTGKWQSLKTMSLDDRQALLQRWATSSIGLQRKAYQSIKQLALFLAYANDPSGAARPFWQVIDYPGEPGGGSDQRTIEPFVIRDNRTLTADVLVIGSGAGGGVVAGELAAAGYDVIVAEKGGHYEAADFDGNEFTSSQRFFEKQGLLTTSNGAITVLAGATLGGGTTINWSASFAPPDYVRREWANAYGFSDALSDDYSASIEAVSKRVNINTEESHPNPNNRLLEAGCQALGYNVDVIPRNVQGCEECGFCNYGCSFGAKQSTLKTYLQDAFDQGARILVRADVRRVMHDGSHVTGATLEVTDENGTIHLLTVKAKLVVVAAGSIHTPALLKRSGLDNPNIGANLHLHPTTVIFSRFAEPVKTWRGVPMSRICKDFMNLDGNGYGVALEVAPAHPGLSAATFPWQDAKTHKAIVEKMPYMANVIALTRDFYGGSVTTDRYGQPVLHYDVHPYDKQHLMRGILEALKIHYAAGANEIYTPHNKQMAYHRDNGESFPRFLRRVEDEGLEDHKLPLFTAHQMSSARIAGSPRQGALKPSGESWEIANLFVADGSVLPTATGVNPMISIMSTAHYIAQQIKARLN